MKLLINYENNRPVNISTVNKIMARPGTIDQHQLAIIEAFPKRFKKANIPIIVYPKKISKRRIWNGVKRRVYPMNDSSLSSKAFRDKMLQPYGNNKPKVVTIANASDYSEFYKQSVANSIAYENRYNTTQTFQQPKPDRIPDTGEGLRSRPAGTPEEVEAQREGQARGKALEIKRAQEKVGDAVRNLNNFNFITDQIRDEVTHARGETTAAIDDLKTSGRTPLRVQRVGRARIVASLARQRLRRHLRDTKNKRAALEAEAEAAEQGLDFTIGPTGRAPP